MKRKSNAPKVLETGFKPTPDVPEMPGKYQRRIIGGILEVWADFEAQQAFCVFYKDTHEIRNKAYARDSQDNAYLLTNISPIKVEALRAVFMDPLKYPTYKESIKNGYFGDIESLLKVPA